MKALIVFVALLILSFAAPNAALVTVCRVP